MSIDKVRETFFEEARTLLQEMESGVLAIESGNADADAVNALFRCAHTIKGSAGMFGLESIVKFTHTAENVLDLLRTAKLDFDGDLAALLLDCRDHIELLLQRAAEAGDAGCRPLASASEALELRLKAYLERGGRPTAASTGLPATVAKAAAAGGAGNGSEGDSLVIATAWHISLRFHPDAFRRGINPASFIACLGELGSLLHVETLLDSMPAADAMDPETCYFGFEIELKADCDKAAIEAALEFLEGDCEIRIIAPRAKLEEFLLLIQAQAEGERLRLGEILVRSGALTRKELDKALQLQAASSDAAGKPTRPLGEILVEGGLAPPPVVKLALEQQRRVDERHGKAAQVLKVPADRIDHLINLVGEIVIASSATSTLAAARHDAELIESTSILRGLIEEIRDTSLRMRMVPIGATFSRFQRAVRDIAKEIGKEIELVISGAETELDKSMVELIADPLMHLVRNAADHGIEPPAVRQQRGKPVRGRLSLNAYHDSGSVVIEVADDGGGLNRDRIRSKALDRGLITPEQVLEDTDIYRLIFEPGFSTAEAVTNLSGRGVGMDVVKKNIEALRGSIDIDSSPGAGTCMKLRLPLTLAIIDGFLVELANAHYVVPLDMLVECMDLGDEEKRETRQRGFINLRGSALPILHLRDLFGIDGDPPKRENVVVVDYGGQRAGLAVDRLLGQLQVVIKPLPEVFKKVRGVGGSTILGDGRVAMILDIPSLIQSVASAARPATAAAASTAF